MMIINSLHLWQIVVAGILRGIGVHKYVVIINFIGYNLIGLSVSIILAFVAKWELLGKQIFDIVILRESTWDFVAILSTAFLVLFLKGLLFHFYINLI